MKKRSRGRFILFVSAFFMLITLSARGLLALGQQDPEYPKGIITITGRVRLVGTAMFNNLVITDNEDHDWYVENEDRELLGNMQQRQVTVQGEAEYKELLLANGQSAGIRRYLRNIKIVL